MSVNGAFDRIGELLGAERGRSWLPWLQRIQQMEGADAVLKRIADASDKESLRDYLAEARYALVFAGLDFGVEIEPFGRQGPDMRVSRDGHVTVVEVTRFRLVHQGPPHFDLGTDMPALADYGNFDRDVKKAINKVYGKFSQVGTDSSIIAVWNDDEDLEEIEVQAAVRRLTKNESLPKGLSFVVYGSSWAGPKQLYCFPFRTDSPLEPIFRQWREELSRLSVAEHIYHALETSSR